MKYIPAAFVLFISVILAFRVQAWGSENTMYLYMKQQRPDSPRLVAHVANIYSDNGFYKTALKLLSRFDKAGFKINSLYIKCKQQKKLDRADFQSISINEQAIIDLYANEAIINLANLGLDGQCHFDSNDFIELVDKAVAARARSNLERQKILMYKSHYLHRDNSIHAAVRVLEKAFHLYEYNPVPLFLASEWLIDNHEYALADDFYKKAVAASMESGKDYSALIKKVGQRISARNAK